MSRSGQGTGRPPLAITAEGSSRSASRPGAPGFDTKASLGLVGLALAVHMLRSRRFYERVAVAAIALGALRRIGKEDRASTRARLARVAAWNRQETQRLQHKAERPGRAIKGSAGMARSGARALPPAGFTAPSDGAGRGTASPAPSPPG